MQVREPWGLIARVGMFFHIVNNNEPILLLLQASLNTTNIHMYIYSPYLLYTTTPTYTTPNIHYHLYDAPPPNSVLVCDCLGSAA